jgi:hypothetical protein
MWHRSLKLARRFSVLPLAVIEIRYFLERELGRRCRETGRTDAKRCSIL